MSNPDEKIIVNSDSKALMVRGFAIVAIVMSVYHLVSVVRPIFSAEQHQNIHLGFALVLAYLMSLQKAKTPIEKIVDVILLALSVFSVSYIHVNYMRLVTKVGLLNTPDFIVGIILLFVTLDATRRTFGKILPIITVISLLYLKYGYIFKGFFYHAGFKWTRIVGTMTTNLTGMYGSILDISATFIILFMIFGGLLESSGAGQFFIKLALAVGGRTKSGPAQAAVISSCLVGSVNGSAVANVATTGVFTIPLMKKSGYTPEMAGALEAVASTGGMIMPPIMGVGAFVMSGITGIPYSRIALGALIPALLYYFTTGVTAHLYACRHGFKAMDPSEIPSLKEVLKEGWFYSLPLIVVIVSMCVGSSVTRAGLYGIITIVGVVAISGTVNNRKYILSSDFWNFIKTGLVSGAKSAIKVAPACAIMGIMSQAMIMSGLAFKIVFFIKNLSGGYRFLAVLLTMLISTFFGMGVPTTASYALVAVVGASALVELGFSPLAVHMFIYYYAILANITPPVCAAVLVASQIAQADYMKTGLKAVRIGLTGFILPFLFIYYPELLMDGSVFSIITTSLSAFIGVFALASFFEGYLMRKSSVTQRIIILIASVALIIPGILTDVVGLVFLGTIIMWQMLQNKKQRTTGAIEDANS